MAYAERIHRGQTRKKTRAPTLSHLLAVTALVLEHGGDEDEAIAALLHDGPEDCNGRVTLAEIRERFGGRVAGIVEGCTDSMDSPKQPWQERKEGYIATLGSASESTHLVSLADKVHNVRSLVSEYRQVGESLWHRFNASREQTLWYYRSVLEVFEEAGHPRGAGLREELAVALAQLEAMIADASQRSRVG